MYGTAFAKLLLYNPMANPDAVYLPLLPILFIEFVLSKEHFLIPIYRDPAPSSDLQRSNTDTSLVFGGMGNQVSSDDSTVPSKSSDLAIDDHFILRHVDLPHLVIVAR